MAGITFPKELIKQNEKKSTCDYCRNKDICKYSKDLLEFVSKIDELELEMIDAFKIEVRCKHFAPIDSTRYMSVRDIGLAGDTMILSNGMTGSKRYDGRL